MQYIIMCGGEYNNWQTPRQMLLINGESLVERTIRLLKENGVKENNIAISTNDERFSKFGLSLLHHENDYKVDKDRNIVGGLWCHCFYPTDEPTCYIFGDVVFSPQAIKTIVNTPTTDIEFFASAPPFAYNYRKPWAEPFALKVVDTNHLKAAIKEVEDNVAAFHREPIMWELWQVIKHTPYNKIIYTNYCVINDYTCDIDTQSDINFYKDIK